MKKHIIYIITLLLSSCISISSKYKYSESSKLLISTIMSEEYEKAYDLFAYDKYGAIPIDTFKLQIEKLRNKILNNFGTKTDISLIKVEKRLYNNEANVESEITKLQFQIKNKVHYGYITVFYDNQENKAVNINFDNVKNSIPSMTLFWLFGIFPIIVLGYNIYTIRKVSKSQTKRKWLKIIGIIILNVPALTFSVVNGFGIEFFSFQILLGVSFNMTGYVGTYWTFGVPIGSIIANYKLRSYKKEIN